MATGRPLHFMFGSRVGFWGMADRMVVLFPVWINPRWRLLPYLKNFKWPYLRNRSSDPLHLWYYGVFGDGGSNDAILPKTCVANLLCLWSLEITSYHITVDA